MNVRRAWRAGLLGEGALIVVVDDGVEYEHVDLAANFAPEYSADLVGVFTDDPRPRSGDAHGTGAASLCAGVNNVALNSSVEEPYPHDFCGVGVAPLARHASLRTPDRLGDASMAHAIARATEANDTDLTVLFMTGPSDTGTALEGFGTLGRGAVRAAAERAVVLWSAGNGGDSKDRDSCAYDGYVNSRHTLAVGAVGPQPFVVQYSEPCGAVHVCASSSDDRVPMWAAQLLSFDAASSKHAAYGHCAQWYGGTSGAAAVAAGAVALIRRAATAAGSDLRWIDYHGVLAYTAQRVVPDSEGWITNAAGLRWHPRLGFGLIDTWAAAWLAANHWKPYPPANETVVASEPALNVTITGVLASTLPVVDVDEGRLQHVALVLTVTHDRRGQLRVLLRSPSGTEVTVTRERPKDRRSGTLRRWQMLCVAFWDEPARGNWTLTLVDSEPDDDAFLALQSWELHLFTTPEGSLSVPANWRELLERADEALAHTPAPTTPFDTTPTTTTTARSSGGRTSSTANFVRPGTDDDDGSETAAIVEVVALVVVVFIVLIAAACAAVLFLAYARRRRQASMAADELEGDDDGDVQMVIARSQQRSRSRSQVKRSSKRRSTHSLIAEDDMKR